MKLENMRVKVISAALAGIMGLSMCSPVLAIAAEGDTANSNITIEAEASSINVTVPTNAAFVFKGDGTNVYPSNYEVTNNNGLTAITLNSIDFEGVNGWSLTTEDDTFQADQKKFALKMGLKDSALSVVDKNNGVPFSGDTQIKIAPQSSQVLGFEAVRGVFSSLVTTESAVQMTMHFDWEHAKAPQLVEKVNRAYKAMENNRDELAPYLGGICLYATASSKLEIEESYIFETGNPNIDASYAGGPLWLKPAENGVALASNLNEIYTTLTKSGATHMTLNVGGGIIMTLTVAFDDGSSLMLDGADGLSTEDGAVIYTVDPEGNTYEMYTYEEIEGNWVQVANPEAAFKTLQYE